MEQQELWRRVYQIKRRVIETIGTDLSYEFRASQVYQNYTGLCGEAQLAYEEGELNDQIVFMLAEYAEKVIQLRNKD